VNFLGKIAIVGNIAGTRIYDLPNQSVGYIFSSSNQTTIFNTIRKNLALLKRNIPDTTLEDPNSTFEFMIQKSGDYIFRNSWIWPLEKRTIVVVGHDIILDQDYINPSPTQPTALIALQDDNGNG
jgi:hypothetical protein